MAVCCSKTPARSELDLTAVKRRASDKSDTRKDDRIQNPGVAAEQVEGVFARQLFALRQQVGRCMLRGLVAACCSVVPRRSAVGNGRCDVEMVEMEDGR